MNSRWFLAGTLGLGTVWLAREVTFFLRSRKFKKLEQDYQQALQGLAKGQAQLVAYQEQKDALVQHFQEKVELLQSAVSVDVKNSYAQAFSEFQSAFLHFFQPVASGWQESCTREQKQVLTQATGSLAHGLEKMAGYIKEMEQSRQGAYQGIWEHIGHLVQGQKELAHQTSVLATALRAPHVRGCWGEMQLKRVLEISGMLPYCDFEEQVTLKKDGERLRPDVIVRLSKDKCVVIDAKAPILHYIEACQAHTTQEYDQKLKEHERILAGHVKKLADKGYAGWEKDSVDFVLLFVPGDSFLSEALRVNPSLIEWAAQQNVILTSPSLLIALLKTIAYGWRQEKIAAKMQDLFQLAHHILDYGTQLQEGLHQMNRHLQQSSQFCQKSLSVLELKLMQKVQKFASFSEDSSGSS